MSNHLSRRTFLQTATATTAAAYAARVLPAWAVDRGSVAINTSLTTFAYSEVELFDGPMKQQFEENHARFLNLDDDRLLKVFRQVAGLPCSRRGYGRLVRPQRFQPGAQRLSWVHRRPQFWTISFWAWPGPTRSLDRSQRERKSIAWSRDTRRHSTPRPSSSWTTACPPIPTTSFPAA